jgi:hypothetical protein
LELGTDNVRAFKKYVFLFSENEKMMIKRKKYLTISHKAGNVVTIKRIGVQK